MEEIEGVEIGGIGMQEVHSASQSDSLFEDNEVRIKIREYFQKNEEKF